MWPSTYESFIDLCLRFKCHDLKCFIPLFKSLLHPDYEYISSAWAPHRKEYPVFRYTEQLLCQKCHYGVQN